MKEDYTKNIVTFMHYYQIKLKKKRFVYFGLK